MAKTDDVHIPSSGGLSSVSYNTLPPPSEHSSSTPPALTSLYVTFKVLQLVNGFCKRVKTRVRAAKESPATVQEDFCQAFERQAYEDIDRHLGRKRLHPELRTRRKAFGDRERGFVAPQVITAESPLRSKTIAAKRIEWLLREVNKSVTSGGYSPATIARSDALFLNRFLDFQVKRLSIKQLTHLIVVVKDLLATLSRAIPLTSKPKLLANGTEVLDPANETGWFDEGRLANLEHLLLCLQDQLLRQLVARCVELVQKHLIECQKDQGKRCLEWFSEFPDAQHPLSTTWPWSIKPSLAVLWGVCWMFYDNYGGSNFDGEGNMVDDQGNIVVPNDVVQQYVSAVQRQRQRQGQAQSPVDAFDISSPLVLGEVGGQFGIADPFADNTTGTNSVSLQAAPHATAPPGGRMVSSSPTRLQQQQQQQQQHHHPNPHHRHHRTQQLSRQQTRSSVGRDSWAGLGHGFLPVPSPTDLQAGGLSGDLNSSFRLAESGTNNNAFAGGVAAPSTYVDSGVPAAAHQHVPRFLPQESFSTGLGFQTSSASPYQSTDAVDGGAWSLLSPTSQPVPEEQPRSFYAQRSPSRSLPQRPRPQNVTPTIRVTTDFAAQAASFPSQPQDTIYSASSNSSLPHSDFYNPHYPSSGHLSPQGPTASYMPQDPDMQTPPRSTHGSPGDTTMGDVQHPFSRKRSHSTMSQSDLRPSSAHHSRAPSITSNAGISPADDTSPRGSRAFKRGDPPINHDNKYVCDFAEECRGLVFDRKCEWSKHMDKHDRPYRCPQPSCAKLQGFTYSGGLLRHEREVHGKHGGPKAQLMCPMPECKRHVGKGFTRKENLNEHLRRVHSIKDQPSQNSAFRRDTQDTITGAEEVETPASRISEVADFDEHSMMSPGLGKRKRSIPGVSERATPEDVDDLKQQLKRLRSEAEHKDERIRQMEESGLAQDTKIRTLEEAVLRLQQQQHQQQASG